MGADDPFGTAALRARVLDAYAASPARLREDANAEEDLVLGGYRDRVLVELAQNAADSAQRAGVPGRLLLDLQGGTLVAANTGAPLDAAGVEALSTLRASSKRSDESAGRFGVGFAAVLAVSDTPSIGSALTGGVGWSRAAAVDSLAHLAAASEGGELGAELARRGTSVPVLRLPEPREVAVPEGYDTAVVLALRDPAAVALVGRLLDELTPVLLLALPALAEVVIRREGGQRTLTAAAAPGGVLLGDDSRGAPAPWRVVRRSAEAPSDALAGRPLEERGRRLLSVTWAVPVDPSAADDLPGVVLAPTPTDEPLGLPAVLVATLPLEPTRRRAVPGPLLTAVVGLAAAAYVALLEELARDDPARALAALPGPLAAGEVDAMVRAAATELLPRALVVPAARGGVVTLERAVVVDGASPQLAALLAAEIDGIAAPLSSQAAAAVERLGAGRVALADAVDSLAGRRREPEQWQALYTALLGAPLDALGALPVPLADGRVVRGARGTVLVRSGTDAPAIDPHAFDVLGVRVVDPGAAHPLLERLGAVPATPAALLRGPEVRAALDAADSMDDDEALELAGAVLALVAADPSAARDSDLSGLLLPDDTGELAPARELLLPDGVLAAVADPAAFGLVDEALLARWGREVLSAVGVVDGFAVVPSADLVMDPDDLDALDLDVDGLADWAAEVARPVGGLPSVAPEALLLRDLDAVDDDRWAEALALLARPPARAAVVEPVRVVDAEGGTSQVPSYAAWWLGRHATLGGRGVTEFAVGTDSLLLRLFEPLPIPLDRELVAAIGVRTSLDQLLADERGVAALLDRLAAPDCTLDRAGLSTVYAALARADISPSGPLPDQVRVPAGPTGTRLVDADDAVVLDSPDLLPLLDRYGVVSVAAELAMPLADLLRLPLASEAVDAPAPRGGVRRAVPGLLAELLPDLPGEWVEHDDIPAGGVSLSWRVVDGEVHACTVDGLARGLAWAAGRWDLRGLLGELLLDPDPGPAAVDRLLAEQDL